LQEYFQERWSKLVTPKLQEEAKQARGEEDALKQRKAAAARAAADLAAQEAACRLASCLDELHEQLAQLRVQVGGVIGGGLVARCGDEWLEQ
jgi:polyhydroxyalkanoate synthesis regulator phasin